MRISALIGPWAMLAGVAAAQAVPDIGGFDASGLTATSILAYFAWHVLNRTLPDLRKDYAEHLRAAREDVRETRDKFQCRAAPFPRIHDPEITP